MQNTYWFQLFKCEYLLVLVIVYDCTFYCSLSIMYLI